MTTQRIVRIRANDEDDRGARLRFEYEPAWGNAVLADENVQPEQVMNADARRVAQLASMQLTTAEVRWLRDTAAELLDVMEGAASAPGQRIYVKHDLDDRWHVLVSAALGASVVTACHGRWPQTEPTLIADRPPPGMGCGGCDLIIARGGPPAIVDDDAERGGEA